MLHSRAALRPAGLTASLATSMRTYAVASATARTAENPVKSRVSTPEAQFQSAAPTRTRGTIQMKTYKPRTPGLRHLKRPVNDHLWKGRPLKMLTYPKIGQGKGGRNVTGQVTVRHRGGGHKRRIRVVDFKRQEPGKQVVERIEYDPNRSAHIALLKHLETKKLSYIIAPEGMRAGEVIESFLKGIPGSLLGSMGGTVDPGMLAAKTAFRGNCLPLHMVPLGTQVFCVGSTKNKRAVFCRSAGTYATVVSKGEVGKKIRDVTIRLQSGELRRCDKDACATIGVASNVHHHFRQLGKAGRSRWLGIRPSVRGVAMNAADHPHGGGRGKSKGNVHPVSPWGVPAKGGYKTRNKRNPNKWVVQERPRNQGKRRAKK
ncbi:Ribosomal protein L2 [Lasiodiplodia theobromae]|uniref:Large ribosomal subunit protein uL2m n=2 Tax=Lasiodiplodia TaxID=66739 RepID=A0A5N5DG78_9PEZI|nr:Ribosomal protein L2 [Lasiodiplodia theobromae]KAB2576052.1 54S ribosomal protein RML2 [Lasiodiplodia theobromae]KAF4534382.1 Ribosomal protein L2 [Lasiodiplodia theobromae]KAF9640056.1 Ribosomal protein L2 [Lasiodiplodia theobromae]KAK0647728.1 54S ribosomal protein RML2 [Lasiodiplodia hormozganensis]